MTLWYRFCRFLAQAVVLLLFRPRMLRTERVPRAGGALLICNHQSFLDPALAGIGLPRAAHFMARDTLFRGAFGRLIASLNAFPVKRSTGDVGAIKETLRRLKHGALITVFPEGTRTTDGRVQSFQSGVVLLARKAGVPLVPTLVLGAYECWPRSSPLPRPSRVLIAYGHPLTTEQITGMSDEACVELVRQRVLELMAEFRTHPHVAGRLHRPTI
ncbi:MAG: 1-acyl-sn-glycerol-3-phosphate acyltransferase [Planctomycetes bacterium]|nr:1-acyl-sn-glycerol-3-phosphate acyltransferase [Planctomycetota bacterium]